MGETSVILSIKIIKRDNGIVLNTRTLCRETCQKVWSFDVALVGTSYDANTQLKKN